MKLFVFLFIKFIQIPIEIYSGIGISFAFILIFVRLLTPDLERLLNSLTERTLPNGYEKLNRPYYAIIGSDRLFFEFLIIIVRIT